MTTLTAVAEARCPDCNKLLARNFDGCADLRCPRCNLEVRISVERGALTLTKL